MATDNRMYKYFSKKELACRCGKCGLGQEQMSPRFMEKLEYLRSYTGITMPVTSAVRCIKHNNKVSKAKNTLPHTLIDLSGVDNGIAMCHAVDINMYGGDLDIVLEGVYYMRSLGFNFTGIGLNQKGPYNQRFIHLDDLSYSQHRKRNWIWTY